LDTHWLGVMQTSPLLSTQAPSESQVKLLVHSGSSSAPRIALQVPVAHEKHAAPQSASQHL